MKEIIDRPRNKKGVFIAFLTEDEKKENIKKTRHKYFNDNPWLKHLAYARSRCYRSGLIITLTINEIKELWVRDDACKLISPSIDRINSNKGYLYCNCRFIEQSLNTSLSHVGRIITDKQRKAGSENLSEYWRKKK